MTLKISNKRFKYSGDWNFRRGSERGAGAKTARGDVSDITLISYSRTVENGFIPALWLRWICARILPNPRPLFILLHWRRGRLPFMPSDSFSSRLTSLGSRIRFRSREDYFCNLLHVEFGGNGFFTRSWSFTILIRGSFDTKWMSWW